MGAERSCHNSGQAILETLLSMPLVLAMVFIVVRVNMLLQMSIVNQQYSRAQAFELVGNSSIYPELRFRYGSELAFTERGHQQMVLGVSGNLATEGYTPEPLTMRISRQGGPQGSNDPGEPAQRGLIRIRNNIVLCTQTESTIGAGALPLDTSNPDFGEGFIYSYCNTPYGEEG